MKNLAVSHCLVIATCSLLAVAMPAVGVAQESPPNEESAVAQPLPQKRFVSDQLVLNVYAQPEQGSARVATIQTGDEVEELERSGNLVRVRLEDGREGWVGANYLVSDAPAIVRVRELQREQPSPAPHTDKASTEEIARLKKENAVLQGRVSELHSRINAPVAPPLESERAVETAVRDAAIETPMLATAAPNGGVLGWLIAIMFVGAVSFAGGYQTLARRLRKRFGGLKVY